MSEKQLALIETGPKLTGRQQLVLACLEHAGTDGLQTDEAGAILHASRSIHGTDDRCRWCGKTGREVLEALRAKNLARYRSRLKVWQTVDAGDPEPPRSSAMLADTEPIPF